MKAQSRVQSEEHNILRVNKGLVNYIHYLFIPTNAHIYKYAPHNDVSVNDGSHIQRWSHNIVIVIIVLQLPTVFSTVTCCTGL